VPPVHIVVDPETEHQEVLDGQQRLAAIRDFAENKFSVNGYCQPLDSELVSLHGTKYEKLPDRYRRRFDTYSIRVIKISDYSPEEPGELFYRLNQPTNLTAAEQRNAFYGPARSQVKEIVSEFTIFGLNERTLGFPNSRMAYDDIVARVCFTLSEGSLRAKVTSGQITDLYRLGRPLESHIIRRVTRAFDALGRASASYGESIRFNKATLYSWAIFACEYEKHRGLFPPDVLGHFLKYFEESRQSIRGSPRMVAPAFDEIPPRLAASLLEVFNDRSSARVADVSSVCARDFVLWLFASMFEPLSKVFLDTAGWAVPSLLKQYVPVLWNVSSQAEVAVVVDEIVGKTSWGSDV